MSIKAEKWIRRMAEQQGMLEPFEAGHRGEVEGRNIGYYGTSDDSYDTH